MLFLIIICAIVIIVPTAWALHAWWVKYPRVKTLVSSTHVKLTDGTTLTTTSAAFTRADVGKRVSAPPCEWCGIKHDCVVCRSVPGCCDLCGGTGFDASAYESAGRCWDCYGTGHAHDPRKSC